jgi:hypothetical protein
MHLFKNNHLNKSKKSLFVDKIFKHNEILKTRTEVLMINKMYHIINSLIKFKSILLFKNQHSFFLNELKQFF